MKESTTRNTTHIVIPLIATNLKQKKLYSAMAVEKFNSIRLAHFHTSDLAVTSAISVVFMVLLY